MTKRITYIDTIKGILILCLLYGHYKNMAWSQGMNDKILRMMNATVGLYGCFFMQTFFIITGFCSSFNNAFSQFLWKNIKTLIIPAIILTLIECLVLAGVDGNYFENLWQRLQSFPTWLTTGGPWFIIALFWAKMFFWFISKLSNPLQLVVCVVLYMTGLFLNESDILPNYMWHRHTLLMIIYLYMGYFAKSHRVQIGPWVNKLAIVAIPLILAINYFGYHTPYLDFPWHDYNIGINYSNFYIHILTVVCATALIVVVGKKLSNSSVLNRIGGGTLLVYLLNGAVQIPIILMLKPLYNTSSILTCVFVHVTGYMLCVAVMYMLIRLIYGHKRLSWIVGKWQINR